MEHQMEAGSTVVFVILARRAPTPYFTLICLYITVKSGSGSFAGEQDGIPLESTRSSIWALSDMSLTDQQADGRYRCWLACI